MEVNDTDANTADDDAGKAETEMNRLERLAKNREHARNSRQRKKNSIQSMQERLEALQNEAIYLKTELESRVSNTSGGGASNTMPFLKGDLVERLKQLARDEKTSVKRKADDVIIEDVVDPEFLTVQDNSESSGGEQVKSKKERNKEHAKLARDRKKLFIEKLKESIVFLEDTNNRIRLHLQTFFPHIPLNQPVPSWTAEDEEPLDYI